MRDRVRLFGGTLRLDSKPARAATVSAQFPLTPQSAGSRAMIRLLLADDHTVLRECLVTALRASGDCLVVAEAGDGINAIEQAHAVRPDVAIVDISMPRLNGIEVVRRLTTELPRTRVLVLTMHEEDEYVLQVVRAGASGYLIKHAATAELLEAIRAVAAGGVYFGPYATRVWPSSCSSRRGCPPIHTARCRRASARCCISSSTG